MRHIKAVLLASLFLALSACATKPEGPAEKIGRGLDQILEGSQELNDKYSKDANGQLKPVDTEQVKADETEQEKADRERKEFDSRHDYNSDEWWREHDRQIEAEGN